jgi:hypothetical protein
MGTTVCTNDTGSHFVQMAPSVGVKLLTSATSTSASPTGTATGSSENQSCPKVASSTNNGAMIGLGVGLGIALVACAAAGLWLLRSYRKQRAQFQAIQAGPPQQEYYPPSYKADTNPQGVGVYQPEMTGPPARTELGTERRQAPVELETGNRYMN